jgi:hypothetical protein
MNAFQFGIATYKWDAKKYKYVMRPFNFYVFPNSQIMDKRVMQFDTSCINFLMQNKFDFNKLFTQAISYQRLSDKELINTRIAKTFFELPAFNRSYTHLGSQSTKTLKEYVSKVQNFVELSKKNENQYQVLELTIESFALKKQLARELSDLYSEQRIIFTEYKKGSDLFTVRKWRTNGARSLIDSKFNNEENPEKRKKTYIDAIMSKKVTVDRLHEDDLCVVFKPKNTDAKVHLLVVPKDDQGLSSLNGAEEQHEKMLGHLMVVAANMGKTHMPDGFRVVINNGE